MKQSKHPERALHRAVAEMLAIGLTAESWFTTFPAGGGGKIRGSLLRRMGLVPGVPDLMIVNAGRLFWIELKSPTGTVSQAQRLVHRALENVGCQVAVCRSTNDVMRKVDEWKIPHRLSTNVGAA